MIGGGNPGVEAAIGPAGLVGPVALLEFGERLRADAVRVEKLHSLKNVIVHTQAQTTEITGTDGKVKGLRYTDRASGAAKHVEPEGVFVQIGLVPSSEWLKGMLGLSRHCEIVVDNRGQTSLPGVFAAGDVTTVPFKPVIIAKGDGAKAALGAFDHLIRSAVPVPVLVPVPVPESVPARCWRPEASGRRGREPADAPAIERVDHEGEPDRRKTDRASRRERLVEYPHADRQLDRRPDDKITSAASAFSPVPTGFTSLEAMHIVGA